MILPSQKILPPALKKHMDDEKKHPKQPPGLYKTLVNNGINYQPQRVNAMISSNNIPEIPQTHPPGLFRRKYRLSPALVKVGTCKKQFISEWNFQEKLNQRLLYIQT